MITEDIKAAALDHANKEYPREACGLVVSFNRTFIYWPCKNIAEKSTQFIMDPLDYARAEDSGEVVAIIHSHPNTSPKPSQADLVACELSGLPWYIVAVPIGTWETIHPSGYKAPLLGREFVHGVLDCYSLVRDFYQQELNTTLPDFDRIEDWPKKGKNLYMENFNKAGFKKHDGPLKKGDVILMQVGSKVVNHAAVYLGNDKIIHHLSNQLSTRDIYGGFWRRCTRLVIRFHGIENI